MSKNNFPTLGNDNVITPKKCEWIIKKTEDKPLASDNDNSNSSEGIDEEESIVVDEEDFEL